MLLFPVFLLFFLLPVLTENLAKGRTQYLLDSLEI
jgi:hypothetical protein